MQGDNLTWMTYIRQLISEKRLNFTFWCYNANSGDTGGLVKDDFKTWDEEKYAFVKEVLWMDDNGKFVGLDHKVPLGNNGIALSDWTGFKNDPAPAAASASSSAEPAGDGTEGEPSASQPAAHTAMPQPVGPDDGSGSTGSNTALIVILSAIGAAAAVVIVVMIIKIRGLAHDSSAKEEDDPDAPVVINGYLQKSNTYTPRPVYSNTAEARKAQEEKLKEQEK